MAIDASTESLPSHAYVPGINQRHEEEFLDHIKAAAPTETLDSTSADNQAWLYGLRLIQQDYFWEAHEILETVWMRALPNSRERHLVQGVIHLANAALKQKMGRPEAAERLFNLAEDCILEASFGLAGTRLMGLDPTELQATITKRSASDLKTEFSAI